jgi:hypothetical protein
VFYQEFFDGLKTLKKHTPKLPSFDLLKVDRLLARSLEQYIEVVMLIASQNMKRLVGSVFGCLAITFASSIGNTVEAETNLQSLVHQAASSNPTDVQATQAAITSLRDLKDAGVQAFWTTYQAQLPADRHLRSVLDRICQQKDCDTSRLYWYTDLDQAKAAASASGKPILSLRLLGHLDEDLSCANSRFFRTVLYPNAEISQQLRDRFILHWQSERPVPKVTIDFGDGRKLQRTLTGNSIHYVLDAAGRPVDALPGLYAPKVFHQMLIEAEQAAKQSASLSGNARNVWFHSYHRDRLSVLQNSWKQDLAKLGVADRPLLTDSQINSRLNPNPANSPAAELAGQRAITKALVERPLLRQTRSISSIPIVTDRLTDAQWQQLGTLRNPEIGIDVNSQALMRRKLSNEIPFRTILTNFERAIAQDTVRNEYLMRPQIHQWFANWSTTDNLSRLNERVYTSLFLTPSSDPWLGLAASDVYTGIEANSQQ